MLKRLQLLNFYSKFEIIQQKRDKKDQNMKKKKKKIGQNNSYV